MVPSHHVQQCFLLASIAIRDSSATLSSVQLHQLEYFVAVADALSFTAGARNLHVVQSAVSAAVRQLEKELGAELFVRYGRRIRLTPEGEALLPHARSILAQTEAARDAVDAVHDVVRGTVVLGTLTHVGPIDTVSVLSRLSEQHPGVVVKLRQTTAGTRSSLENIRSGVLDLAIVASPAENVPGIAITPLHTEPIVFICPKEHRLAGATQIRLEDLADERFIDFPEGWGNRMVVEAAFAAAGAERTVQTEVVGFEMAVELVSRGFGVAFVAASALTSADDSVWSIPTQLEWRMQLARSSARPPTQAESVVVRAFEEAASQGAGVGLKRHEKR
jgi:DNA-binding transcriptional LysR family regulator